MFFSSFYIHIRYIFFSSLSLFANVSASGHRRVVPLVNCAGVVCLNNITYTRWQCIVYRSAVCVLTNRFVMCNIICICRWVARHKASLIIWLVSPIRPCNLHRSKPTIVMHSICSGQQWMCPKLKLMAAHNILDSTVFKLLIIFILSRGRLGTDQQERIIPKMNYSQKWGIAKNENKYLVNNIAKKQNHKKFPLLGIANLKYWRSWIIKSEK